MGLYGSPCDYVIHVALIATSRDRARHFQPPLYYPVLVSQSQTLTQKSESLRLPSFPDPLSPHKQTKQTLGGACYAYTVIIV